MAFVLAFTLKGSHDLGHPVPQSLLPLRCLGQTSNSYHPLRPVAVAYHKASTTESFAVQNQTAADFPITSSSTLASLAVVVFRLEQP